MKHSPVRFLAVAAIGLAGLSLSACKQKEFHEGHDMKSMEGMQKESIQEEVKTQTLASAELKIGDKAVCPVMKSKFTVRENSSFVEVDGKKVYVCCADCVQALKADPKKYLN